MNGAQKPQREGRNAPCPCGSGLKWKKCHGAPPTTREGFLLEEQTIAAFVERMRAQQLQREQQQGLGKPIIYAEFQGYRFVAVGSELLWSKDWRTFHDFLFAYLPRILGQDWGAEERGRSPDSWHPLFRLYEAVRVLRATHYVSGRTIQSAAMTGAAAAYLGLAYNLYLLAHNAAVQERLIKRLRHKDQFWPALYETSVAAKLIQAGFSLRLEEEADPSKTHCEFIATHRVSGRSFSVEAKYRQPNKEGFGVSNQLHAALKKSSDHPRIVFIDINVDARGTTSTNPFEVLPWLKGALESIRGREQTMTIRGLPAPPAYVIVTSEPYEACLNVNYAGLAFAAEGFKIADLKIDSAMTVREARLARESHREIYELLASMLRHQQIPVTFDGEFPEFAFGETEEPRLIVGQEYLIPGPNGEDVIGVLEQAIANPESAKAIGVYRLADGTQVLATNPLTRAEVAAYKRHPETFFGTVSPSACKANDPLDLYDFFFETYGHAPREKLLDLISEHQDAEQLVGLTREELAILYCERLVEAAVYHAGGSPSTT